MPRTMKPRTCPTCGVRKLFPSKHVPTTPWTDECCCCDQFPCEVHGASWGDAPKRPIDVILEQRAEVRLAGEMERWEAAGAKFERMEQALQAMDELKLLLNLPFDISPEAVVASVEALLEEKQK